MVDFYCEPIGERRVAKEDYFEARGSAEIHPQQKSVDSKLRRDMSTSMIFVSKSDILKFKRYIQ